MRREEPEPSEVESRIQYLVSIMYEESYSLGYALRRHNARAANNQGKPIIVQNVLEDWMSMSYISAWNGRQLLSICKPFS